MRANHEKRITNHGLNPHVSPRGEAKWVRGPSGLGASRLARTGVLEPYVEHGKQAQRSPGGRIACFDRRVVRNAGYRFSGRQVFHLERTRPPTLVCTKHESRLLWPLGSPWARKDRANKNRCPDLRTSRTATASLPTISRQKILPGASVLAPSAVPGGPHDKRRSTRRTPSETMPGKGYVPCCGHRCGANRYH